MLLSDYQRGPGAVAGSVVPMKKRNPHILRRTEYKLITTKPPGSGGGEWPTSSLRFYSEKEISTWSAEWCEKNIDAMDDYRPHFMEKCGGDLSQLAAFARQRKLIAERLKDIPIPAPEVIPDDYKGNGWPPNKQPDPPPPIPEIHADECGFDLWSEIKKPKPVIMSRGDFARAEATFSDRDWRAFLDNILEDGYSSNYGIPNEILAEAETNNSRVGIDLLALGKPFGGIFNPDHWMYDQIRDRAGSILNYYFINFDWQEHDHPS